MIRGRWEDGARPVAWKHRQTNPAWPSAGRRHKARPFVPVGFETGPVTALTKSPCAGYLRCHSHRHKPSGTGRAPHPSYRQVATPWRGQVCPTLPLTPSGKDRPCHVGSPPAIVSASARRHSSHDWAGSRPTRRGSDGTAWERRPWRWTGAMTGSPANCSIWPGLSLPSHGPVLRWPASRSA